MDFSQKHIKGYEVKERIGAGGFGAVYRAYQSTVGREVAIKVILPGLSSQPDFIRRFESEAQLVARLEHPHITPLYDYWRDLDGAYLVMRWLRGGSLRDSLQHGAFELHAAVTLLDQIAAALSLAHRNGIIHRDIKPANILLDEDGNAYLTDFGIAKDLNITGNGTQPDAIIGSLDYISPEQARSEAVTARTDIYSLGVTLYEILTGHHPFENASSIERLYKHINDPLPDIEGLDPKVQDAINTVIQKATQKNPENRYADALGFAADFRQAVGLHRSSTTMEELLTQREHDILNLIIEGLSNKEIANRLTITVGTVKWYANQIYDKLGVRSRVQAIVRARELNLISRGDQNAVAIPIDTEDFHPENPYKGLRAFQASDNQDFFGREKITAKLLRRFSETTDNHRFLAVIGPSGSGKSSLVKAGLIPALWRGEVPNSEKWFIAEMLPGPRPIDALEIALTRVAANQASHLHEHLQRDKFGLTRVASLILPNDETELVIFIDQFEEVFTLVEDESARAHFLDLIVSAVTEIRSRVRIIITLRADFYDRPLHYPQFGELVRNRLETIMPLSAEELEHAIRKPAERVGMTFEAGLVSSIVSDVNYQPGALPLLQYALSELFENRQGRLLTREAYQSIGKVTGALAKRAEDTFQQLNPSDQELTRQMFLRLVTLGEGTEDTRRRTNRAELLGIAPDSDTIDELIDAYATYRLLSLDNDASTRQPTIEVAHEALIREWERLKLWLNDSRAEIHLQRQIAQMAGDWSQAKQDKSFLARGSRLETFENWVSQTDLSLTPKERAFLDASVKARDDEQQAETEQKIREAQLEKRSQTVLRALVVVFAVATTVAVILSVIALNYANEAQQQRDRAEVNLQRAEAQRIATEANRLYAQGANAEIISLLAIHSLNLRYTNQGDEALLNATLLDYPIQSFIGHTDRIKAVDFSPDGRYVLTGSGDSTVRLWDIISGQEIRQFTGGMDDINTAVFSPNGQVILTGSRHDHMVRLWDTATGQELERYDSGNSATFSLDGMRIFIYSEETLTSQIIDLATRQVLHENLNQRPRRPEYNGYSPDGTLYIANSTDDLQLHVRSVTTEEELLAIPLSDSTSAFVISNDNHYLALNDGNDIIIYDLIAKTLAQTLVGHVDGIASLVFSANSQRIVTAGNDRIVIVWDIASGRIIDRFTGHNQAVRTVAISRDGRFVLSGSFDQHALLWEINQPQTLPNFDNGNENIWFASYDDSDDRLVVASDDGTVRVWNGQTETISYTLELTPESAWFAAFSEDGNWLITGGETSPSAWNAQTGILDHELDIPTPIRYLFMGAGNTLITLHDADDESPSRAILWDIRTGDELHRYETPFPPDYAVMSPDETHIAIFTVTDNKLYLFDTQTGIQQFVWNVSNRVDTSGIPFAFSPDSNLLFAGTGEGIGLLWDVQSGEQIQSLSGHNDRISGVDFSPDGSLIATTSADNSLRLWDRQTGHELRRIVLPVGLLSVDFSQNGRYLIVLASDLQIYFFDTDIAYTIANICSHLLRDFTAQERQQYELANLPTCTLTNSQ